MKKIIFLLFALIFAEAIPLLAGDFMYVVNPRRGTARYPANIEKMSIVAMPQGTYIQTDVYLTFTAANKKSFSSTDILEAVYEFYLPKGAYIKDLWLFVNDSVYIQGVLQEQSLAQEIYEGIVRRNQDPAIIFKKNIMIENKYDMFNYDYYMIRVFPMNAHLSRTVKFSIDIPVVESSNEGIIAEMPSYFIRDSQLKPDKIDIYVKSDYIFKNPFLKGKDYLSFKSIFHPNFGNVNHLELFKDQFYSDIMLGYKKTINGNNFTIFSIDEEINHYQTSIDMGTMLANEGPQNFVFIFNNYSTILSYRPPLSFPNKSEMLQKISECIRKYLTPKDSFNIFYTCNNSVRHFGNWVSADAYKADVAISKINPDSIKLIDNNTVDIIVDAANWANDRDNVNFIYLGTLVQGISKIAGRLNDALNPNSSFSTFIISGNDNIKGIISDNLFKYSYCIEKLIDLYRYRSYSINITPQYLVDEYFEEMFSKIAGGIKVENYTVTMNNGQVFENFTRTADSTNIRNNRYFFDYGMFSGEMPLQYEITGKYRNKPFSRTITLENFYPSHSDSKTIFEANRVGTFEKDFVVNFRKQGLKIGKPQYDSLLYYSLRSNVLTYNTAWLATEFDKFDTLNTESDELSGMVPVELTDFDGRARSGGIDLFWATSSEINNFGFYLDRKRKDTEFDFKNIAFLKGAGKSDKIINYSWFDKDVVAGATYEYMLTQVDLDGTHRQVGLLTIKYDELFNLTLEQNHPNPFSDYTKINFTINTTSDVKLEIIDMMGVTVNVLVNKKLSPSTHQYIWNGTGNNGNALPSGIYFYRLSVGEHILTGKMILIMQD